MASKKITMDPAKQAEISSTLTGKGFSMQENEHAFWRAKSKDLTVIFYKNGSVLLQGAQDAAEGILDLFGGPQSDVPFVYPVLGLDESGKGDYFGPLVLAAAVIVTGEEENSAIETGVKDSKKLNDNSIRKIYSIIKDSIGHEVRVIEPAEYNELYRKFGNMNHLMDSVYRDLVLNFSMSAYNTVILDKFSSSETMNDSFRKTMRCETVITEKGERFTAVAAASIFARFFFIDWLEKYSAQTGIALPKGSGYESSMLFKRLRTELPRREFENLAKAHFKAQE